MSEVKCCDIPDFTLDFCEVEWSRIFIKYVGDKKTDDAWSKYGYITSMYEGRYSETKCHIRVNYEIEADGLSCDDQMLLIKTLWKLVADYGEFTCNMFGCMNQQHPIVDEVIDTIYDKLSLDGFGEVEMSKALFHLRDQEYQMFAYDFVAGMVQQAMYDLSEEGAARFLDFEVTILE